MSDLHWSVILVFVGFVLGTIALIQQAYKYPLS